MIACLAFDADFDKGLGHISRLVAIAQFLLKNNLRYCFHSSKTMNSTFEEFILRNGLDVRCACKASPDLIFLDSYNPSLPDYFMRTFGAPIILLADEATPISICVAVIEASPIPDTKLYSAELPVLKFRRSPILRKEIYECLSLQKFTPFALDSWLVTLGGADDDIFMKVLEAISYSLEAAPRKITVATNSPLIVQEAEVLGFSSIEAPMAISTIYENFSHVISGAGVTAWEMALLSIPGFAISVAPNQEFQLRYLNENGIRQGVSVGEEMFEHKMKLLMISQNTKFGNSQISNWEFELEHFLTGLGYFQPIQTYEA
jgi:spore coat polysaccharide biosynthesis predicted glycosyltransferase SpsG